jgi:hypothetical protein
MGSPRRHNRPHRCNRCPPAPVQYSFQHKMCLHRQVEENDTTKQRNEPQPQTKLAGNRIDGLDLTSLQCTNQTWESTKGTKPRLTTRRESVLEGSYSNNMVLHCEWGLSRNAVLVRPLLERRQVLLGHTGPDIPHSISKVLHVTECMLSSAGRRAALPYMGHAGP